MNRDHIHTETQNTVNKTGMMSQIFRVRPTFSMGQHESDLENEL